MKFFCNTKDTTPLLCQSNIVYAFVCWGCSAYSVDKTERTFYERTCKHVWTGKGSVINDNLDKCESPKHLFSLSNLTPLLFSDNDSNNDIDSTSLKTDLVWNNTLNWS